MNDLADAGIRPVEAPRMERVVDLISAATIEAAVIAPRFGDLQRGAGATLEWLPLNRLEIDESYQRPLSPAKVATIAQHFDERAFGALSVNHRGSGEYVVFDGQHRAAAMVLARGREALAPCLVFEGMLLPDEARQFALINTGRAVPHSSWAFRARLIAGDQTAHEIARIVAAAGLEISFTPVGPTHKVGAVRTMEVIFNDGGKEALGHVLHLLKTVWNGQPHCYSSDLMLGLYNFLVRYQDEMRFKTFHATLETARPDDLRRNAAALMSVEGGRLAGNISRVIRAEYNRKAGKDLSEWNAQPSRQIKRTFGTWSYEPESAPTTNGHGGSG